ncbi:c-type cytochrome biogenesis protein CcmI [Paracoccus cavernae]|uniref:c-type cytochrome biogenesis protein CcmI n=1 Tax=Paracoccus cavernae TaxID=1571207 RepID=UPI0035F46D3C
MLWIICAALAAVTFLAIFAPLMRRGAGDVEPAAAYDLRVYRDQLREVERDLERGLIAQPDAERLRIDIGRKVIEADRALKAGSRQSKGPAVIWGFAALAATLAGAFALYDRIGAPAVPDLPIAARVEAAEKRYAERPSQSEAETAAPKTEQPTPDADYLALIKQLRTAMKERPDDPQGLALLAEHESRLGNYLAAKEAQARLVAIKGDQASAEEHARLAALMVEAAGGTITREAEIELAAALKLDPRDAQARYMAGLLQIQNGRPDRAFPIWANLLAETPADAPWNAPIRALIPDLAWLAGEANYTPPEPGLTAPIPGPDAAAMEAALDMTPEAREEMISGMVAGLEDRLATQGGTPEEWARLISALGVLGQTDRARAIWHEAHTRFASNAQALATVREAAQKAGVE